MKSLLKTMCSLAAVCALCLCTPGGLFAQGYGSIGGTVTDTTGAVVAGAEITTLEGLGTIENPHPLQRAFIEEQAAQCGFCLNAVILTAKAFLDKNPKASSEEIRQAMGNVLCRCFTNVRMLRAIERYQKEVAR